MSILSTGTGALLAFQRALSTVSHNVANINTDGYSRQRTTFATTVPSQYGSEFIGNGTQITDVSRVADQLAISRLFDSTGEVARLKQLSSLSSRVDGLFSDKATSIAGQWSNFFDATSGLSSNASASANRQNLLDAGNSLVTRFKQLNGQLDSLGSEVNNGLLAGTAEANRLATEIAKLNGQIGSNANAAAPDLLDRRDQMISQLIGYTGGSVIQQDGGMMNVYTSGGQAMVVGTNASTLVTSPDPYQPEKLQIALKTPGGSTPLTSKALGGSSAVSWSSAATSWIRPRPNLGVSPPAWPAATTSSTMPAWICTGSWAAISSTCRRRAWTATAPTLAPRRSPPTSAT